MSNARPALIERRSIDYVPRSERHGAAWEQAPFWFLGNLVFLTVAIGFIGPSLGLSVGWTIAAGALGPLFGSLFTAFHASQGPILGLPQMIQSRAQFGFRGVLLPLFGAAFSFTAFNVIDVTVIASGLSNIFGWDRTVIGVLVTVFGVVLAVFGHDWIHKAFRIILYVSLPCYVVLTIGMITGHAAEQPIVDPGGFNWVGFMAQFAATAAFSLTYACYISDYTRYLPRETSPRRLIVFVFIGAAVPVVWLVAVGAWLAVHLGAADALVALRAAANNIVPGSGNAFALLLAITLAATVGLNGYSGSLTVMTAVDSIKQLKPSSMRRIVILCILAVVWTVVGLALPTGYIAAINSILVLMLFLLVPWTAINLVDFFFVRRGHYAISHLFSPSGIYGAWSSRGLVAFAAGAGAMVPFIVVPGSYTGVLARAMGEVDISYVIGLAVSAGVYWMLTRNLDPTAEAAAIAESEQLLEGSTSTGSGATTLVPERDRL
jgi:purine-cytosine permease-like protein